MKKMQEKVLDNLPGLTGKVFTLEFKERWESICSDYIVSSPVQYKDGTYTYTIRKRW